MQVTLVTRRIGPGDGQSRVNYEIARELLRQGHRVELVASAVPVDLASQVRWARIPVDRWPTEALRGQHFALEAWRHLRRSQTPSRLVHLNGFVTWWSGDVNTAHFVHSAWLRNPHHTSRERSDAYGLYQWAYTRLNARLERAAFRGARLVVAVSDQVRRELTEWVGVDDNRIRVIPNGVDPQEFHPAPGNRQDLGLPADAPVLLFAGDLRTPRKNLDTVLRALGELPGTHLAVAGETLHSVYPPLASRLGLSDRVHFLGFRRDLATVMHCADVFVFPSHYETDGLVVREAMASGLPVVTSAQVGAAEAVEPGRSGFVVEDPGDATALADRLRWLLAHPDAVRRMGVAARRAAELHSWRRMAGRYISLYEELADTEPARTGTHHLGNAGVLAARAPARHEPERDPTLRHTIAVCTTGRRATLDATVRAVCDAVAPENAGQTEVLVVLNGTTGDGDRVAPMLSDAFHGSRLQMRLLVERMQGIARARNLALAQARGTVLSFVDDDVRPCGPDWQRSILDAFRSRPDLGVLGGPLRCVVPPGADPDPGWRSPHTDSLLSCFRNPSSGPCDPEAVWTANGSYRLIATAGTRFPEDLGWQSGSELRFAGEDTWFNRRLAARGWTAWYEVRAAADHHVEAERFTPGWLLRRAAVQGRTYFVFRCAEGAVPFSIRLRACGGLVVALFRAVKEAAWLHRRQAFARCLDAAARVGAITLPPGELRRMVKGLRQPPPPDAAPRCAPGRAGVV